MPGEPPEPSPAAPPPPPSPAPAVTTATAAAAAVKKAQPKRQGRPAREEEPELILEAGTLTLRTEPDCEVFLDNRSLGTTPLTKVSLPGGWQTLKLVGPDGAKTLKVEIKPLGNVSRMVALSELK
jgi:hypothetical protein